MFFFEKKEPKNFCDSAYDGRIDARQKPKSFLLLFFKKEVLAFLKRSAHIARNNSNSHLVKLLLIRFRHCPDPSTRIG